jgi:hypothetical protein
LEEVIAWDAQQRRRPRVVTGTRPQHRRDGLPKPAVVRRTVVMRPAA